MLRDGSPIGNRLLAGFFFLFFLSSLSATPFDCLIQSNSVQVLNACFEQYFAHTDTLSLEEWQAALPTGSESFQMRQVSFPRKVISTTRHAYPDQMYSKNEIFIFAAR
jgi:hypothetical protein